MRQTQPSKHHQQPTVDSNTVGFSWWCYTSWSAPSQLSFYSTRHALTQHRHFDVETRESIDPNVSIDRVDWMKESL